MLGFQRLFFASDQAMSACGGVNIVDYSFEEHC